MSYRLRLRDTLIGQQKRPTVVQQDEGDWGFRCPRHGSHFYTDWYTAIRNANLHADTRCGWGDPDDH